MKSKSTQLAIVIAAMILFSVIFVPTASATPEESKEKWTKDHTIKNVKLTKIYKYEEGYLKINKIYSGEELKKKTGFSKLNEEMEIPLETGTVMINSKDDKLVVTENELLLTSKKSGTIKLEKGKEKEYTTKTSMVITYKNDPYQWWNDDYKYPQWTWSKFFSWYVREDPINLAWDNSCLTEVKSEIPESWTDNPSEYTHYVYDPKLGWKKGDGVATSVYRISGGYHARLWTISNGAVVANAHEDDGVFEWPLGHQAIDYEGAEGIVAAFYDGWDFFAYPLGYPLGNEYTNEYNAYNNGNATVITAVK
ncbi:hypothetical protein [Methanolobus vulcani]|uniref:Uncharacterized protein n=1 Tax=Methanolobus vulcani TaxID=38026 RepID=A0A7Z8KQD5_9EURY|nr:hypothetical protein [Methanolobus vulcani]TQD27928.1 hypothetical protein FKV42_02380 [Methanolobus vulcani]